MVPPVCGVSGCLRSRGPTHARTHTRTRETYSASYNRLFRCRFSRPLDTETFLPAFNGGREREERKGTGSRVKRTPDTWKLV